MESQLLWISSYTLQLDHLNKASIGIWKYDMAGKKMAAITWT